ncbi:MAG: hypothetical protein IPG83_00680 [Novosphingobium sp.]|nr:hypothetical protein [Novosphingobium sp.]
MTKETKIAIICSRCGSNRVTRDAWAEWDSEAQSWVLGAIYDYAFCHNCEADASMEEVPFESN